MRRLSKRFRWIVAVLVVFSLPTLYGRLLRRSRILNLVSPVDAPSPQATAKPDGTRSIRIATFNIAHGRGLVPSNFDGGTAEQRIERLDAIAARLRQIDADVVVLNEVDFATSWSNGVNQAKYLADAAGYPHRLEQRNMDGRALVWTWRSGNAVLSKFPLRRPQVLPFPGYAMWEEQLVGKKRGLVCDVEVPHQTVRLFALHLSHRSERLRCESAEQLLEAVDASPYPVFLAGDTNSTRPDFPNAEKAPDGRNAMQLFADGGLVMRPVTAPTPDWYTFRADRPDRVIDWILIDSRLRFDRYEVIPTDLSDHRAVVADVRVPRL